MLNGLRFTYLRDEYVSCLHETKPNYKLFDKNKFEWLISQSNRIHIVDGDLLIYVEPEKAKIFILTLAEAYWNRTCIQKNNYKLAKDQSSDWKLTSLYYYTYFSINTLLSLSWRGHFYADNNLKETIRKKFEELRIEKVKIKSDYLYNIYLENDDCILKLSSPEKTNSHKAPWEIFFKLIEEVSEKINTTDDESMVYDKLNDIHLNLKSTFGIDLRNKYNYGPSVAYLERDGKLDVIIDSTSGINELIARLGTISNPEHLNELLFIARFSELLSQHLIEDLMGRVTREGDYKFKY